MAQVVARCADNAEVSGSTPGGEILLHFSYENCNTFIQKLDLIDRRLKPVYYPDKPVFQTDLVQ